MMVVLAEQPFLLSCMIAVVVAGLGYAWLQTGDRRMAIAAGVMLLLIPAAYLVAGSVETDREKIRATIYRTVEAVEKNDHEAAVAVVGDATTRQRALAELPNYEFHRVRVRNILIKPVEGSIPKEAVVDIDASVVASLTRGGINNQRVVRRIILTFQQQSDGEWLVVDYTHVQLNGQPDNFTPNRI